MSFARQRSTPSTITTRRPSARVMLASAWAVRSGVASGPSSSSTPLPSDSASARARRRARRAAMAPWSSPRIRYREPSLDVKGWPRRPSAHHEVHELARQHDLLDDLAPVHVGADVGGRQAELLQLLL